MYRCIMIQTAMIWSQVSNCSSILSMGSSGLICLECYKRLYYNMHTLDQACYYKPCGQTKLWLYPNMSHLARFNHSQGIFK